MIKTPSIYVDESEPILVGHLAESKKVKDSSRYRSEIKQDLIQEQPYLLGQKGEYEFTAQDLITEILKTLKQEAEKITLALGRGIISDVVITVPATYRQNKRAAMEQAASNAGFTSVQLIEEPVAAAIYYHQQNPATFQEGDVILIYDLGGGTFDATLIKKLGNGFQVLGQPVGIANCGGINFDRAIFQHLKASCSPQLQDKLSARGNSPEKNALFDFCRQIKHQFSGTTEAVGQIPIDHQLYELGRDDFNRMIGSSVEQTIVCCEDLIKSVGLELQDISKVLMVGGSCRIPFIQESIESRLESSVLLIDEPELAVCQGAVVLRESIRLRSTSLLAPSSTNSQIKIQHQKNREQKVMVNNRREINFHLKEGNDYLDSQKYKTAVSYYKTVLEIDPDNVEALFNQGLAYFQLGKSIKAKKNWEICIDLDRKYTQKRLDELKYSNSLGGNMSFLQQIIQLIEQLFRQLSDSISQIEKTLRELLYRKENDLPSIELEVRKVFTYEQSISYFVEDRPDHEEIEKGVILKERHKDGYLITQLFLNERNQPVRNINNYVYGRRLITRELDLELKESFGGKSMIVVE